MPRAKKVSASQKAKNSLVCDLLCQHFAPVQLTELVTAARSFPITARVDLQRTLEALAQESLGVRKFLGLHVQYGGETIRFAALTVAGNYPILVGPAQYVEIDIGEPNPVRCLKNGLWLCEHRNLRFVLLISEETQFREKSIHLEVTAPNSAEGGLLSRKLFDQIEKQVLLAGSYRGKVLSLELLDNYSGKPGSVKVHKLRPVPRDQIVLPESTIQLLERNVIQFVRHRSELLRLNMSVKKGLLFYGPPGTGKTHTIHYIAGQLTDHTTLIVTAEQVGLLKEYVQLARFLQPALVVLEDVDLIARKRTDMRSACEESLLNILLNEMDGLREDALVMFILTTNRPDQLEEALASRPGRIDQAVEFPLPDGDGRRKLLILYARNLQVEEPLLQDLVNRTKGASAAFIKELMRRSAQIYIQSKTEGTLCKEHVDSALDEMLFSGGTLNVKLLGGIGTAKE